MIYASILELIQQTGSRGANAINKATAQTAETARQAGASISNKEADKQNKIAAGQMQVQQGNIAQQMQELAGYANLYNAGQAQINAGFSTAAGGIVSAITSGVGGAAGSTTSTTSTTGTGNSVAGLNSPNYFKTIQNPNIPNPYSLGNQGGFMTNYSMFIPQ